MLTERSAVLLLALVLEAVLSYPAGLYRRIRHPVVWIGSLIVLLEKRWNVDSARSRRATGCALVLVLIALATGTGWLIEISLHGLLRHLDLPQAVHWALG